MRSPQISAPGATATVRFLHRALVILVLKQMSQFRSFGKSVKDMRAKEKSFSNRCRHLDKTKPEKLVNGKTHHERSNRKWLEPTWLRTRRAQVVCMSQLVCCCRRCCGWYPGFTVGCKGLFRILSTASGFQLLLAKCRCYVQPQFSSVISQA